MPKCIMMHEVDDVAHWLASPKREELLKGIAKDIVTFVHPTDGNKVGISMDIVDMDAFSALVQSEEGAEAMKFDGVRPDTGVMMFAT